MASCRRRAGTVVPKVEKFCDLKTADHKILSEESESRNNHRYAWWYKTGQHNGYNRTRAKQKLPRSLMKFLEPTRTFTLTLPWNWSSLARNYPGIIVRQRHTDRKHMGLLKERCAE